MADQESSSLRAHPGPGDAEGERASRAHSAARLSDFANGSPTQCSNEARLVLKILARVKNQGLASALGKWRSFVMEDARMRIEKERLIIKLSNGLATESEIETILLVAIEQTEISPKNPVL